MPWPPWREREADSDGHHTEENATARNSGSGTVGGSRLWEGSNSGHGIVRVMKQVGSCGTKNALTTSSGHGIVRVMKLDANFLAALRAPSQQWPRDRAGDETNAVTSRDRVSSIADALRLEGQYLAGQAKNKGAQGNPNGRGAKIVQLPNDTTQPTLASQGISKRESVEAQARTRQQKAARPKPSGS